MTRLLDTVGITVGFSVCVGVELVGTSVIGAREVGLNEASVALVVRLIVDGSIDGTKVDETTDGLPTTTGTPNGCPLSLGCAV